MDLPEELMYTSEDVWVREEDGRVYIGITDYAQDQLGEIVFVELPEEGDELVIDEPFGSVESTKTVSELFAPVSGTIVEVNDNLEDEPELINDSPYEDAWMIVVELIDETEVNDLLNNDEYRNLIEKED